MTLLHCSYNIPEDYAGSQIRTLCAVVHHIKGLPGQGLTLRATNALLLYVYFDSDCLIDLVPAVL